MADLDTQADGFDTAGVGAPRGQAGTHAALAVDLDPAERDARLVWSLMNRGPRGAEVDTIVRDGFAGLLAELVARPGARGLLLGRMSGAQVLQRADEVDLVPVMPGHPAWPGPLDQDPSAPAVLWVQGNVELLAAAGVMVTGDLLSTQASMLASEVGAECARTCTPLIVPNPYGPGEAATQCALNNGAAVVLVTPTIPGARTMHLARLCADVLEHGGALVSLAPTTAHHQNRDLPPSTPGTIHHRIARALATGLVYVGDGAHQPMSRLLRRAYLAGLPIAPLADSTHPDAQIDPEELAQRIEAVMRETDRQVAALAAVQGDRFGPALGQPAAQTRSGVLDLRPLGDLIPGVAPTLAAYGLTPNPAPAPNVTQADVVVMATPATSQP